MKTLIENSLLKMEYDEKKLFLKSTWNETSNLLNDEKYKEHILEMVTEAEKLEEIRYMLSDTSEFHYPIAPEIQKWVASKVFPLLAKKKVQKSALITTPDIFAQVSIEQLTEENKVAPIQRMYFEDTDDAMDWLFEKV